MTLVYGSVCSGIEAASVAWEPLGWRPKFFAEIEKFPSAVLAHRHGSNMPGEPLAKNGVPNYGDFTQIGTDAGPVDLLVGGTPCQSFSVAGKRLGLDDPRGNLALEFLSLAKRLRARWIVWENVPGVLSSYFGSEQSESEVREGDVGGWAECEEERSFATFLSFVRECGYGFAYRVLDTQYVRTQRFVRAAPQRRRRVILVGYLGDWRRAAAVLLEPESLRGDPPPRRKTGQGAAGAVSARTQGGGGLGTDFELGGGLVANTLRAQENDPHAESKGSYIAFGGGNQSGSIDVSTALTAHGNRQDFEVETFVAHTLRGEGHDASEDGSGRGTPVVPVSNPLTAGMAASGSRMPHEQGALVPIAVLQSNESHPSGNYDPEVSPTLHIGSNGGGQPPAIAFEPYTLMERGRSGGQSLEYRQDGTANAVLTPNGGRGGMGVGAIASDWAVRRLTPTECARLQGFSDDHCRIPWNGRAAADCPDGPQYKAYGNSMSINVMEWVGSRIDLMEKLIREGRV